jgi:hypothetical protein
LGEQSWKFHRVRAEKNNALATATVTRAVNTIKIQNMSPHVKEKA